MLLHGLGAMSVVATIVFKTLVCQIQHLPGTTIILRSLQVCHYLEGMGRRLRNGEASGGDGDSSITSRRLDG